MLIVVNLHNIDTESMQNKVRYQLSRYLSIGERNRCACLGLSVRGNLGGARSSKLKSQISFGRQSWPFNCCSRWARTPSQLQHRCCLLWKWGRFIWDEEHYPYFHGTVLGGWPANTRFTASIRCTKYLSFSAALEALVFFFKNLVVAAVSVEKRTI